MIRQLLLLCSLLYCSMIIGQTSKMLEGRVLNDSIAGIELNVVNLSLQIGTITDTYGTFKIPVTINDTLHVSAVNYESRQIVITPVIHSRGKLSFYLTPKINELDEVIVSTINLTGDLTKDSKSIPFKIYIDPTDLGIPANARPTMTVEERRVYSATAGAGPLGSLINAISGRTKMLKRHLEIAKLRAIVESNRHKFSDSTFIKSLKIPERYIEDFVYYVFEDQQAIRLVNKGDTLGILEFMLKKSSLYLKLKARENDLLEITNRNE